MLEKLKNNNFSKLEKEIVKYILNHEEEIAYLSINELASKTYSSNASIIRLCRKLGCSGYKDFKVKYLKELESSRTLRFLDVNRPFYMGDSSIKIMNSMSSLYYQTINSIINNITIETLDQALDLLISANRILIYSIGDSAITAKSFINKLYKLNKFCILATENHEELSISLNSNNHCVALFISYRGGYDNFFNIARILKNNNTPIITISSKIETTLTKLSDVNIQFPNKVNNDSIGNFYSQICFEFILNTLYSLIYAKNYSDNHKQKKIIDSYNN